MSPKTEKLLDLLKSRQMAPSDVLEKLRSRAEKQDASPRSVTRYLVEKGHLTSSQSDNLLKEVGAETSSSGKAASGGKSGSKSSGSKSASGKSKPSRPTFDDLEPLDSAGGGVNSLDALLNDPSMGAPAPDYSKKKGFGRNKWDTKLMLYGGGGLLAMILLIFLFSFLIFGQSEEEMFKAAEDAYGSASYTDAITKYDQYLEAFPESENHSIAVVHRGLSRMRQVVDNSAWEDSLIVAKTVLPEIRQERQFSEARADLSIMLPDIAEGLVQKANQEQSLELLNQAEEAMELANDRGNIPEEMRSRDRMRNIQIEIRNVERILRRDERLAQAITDINAAVAEGDTATAYEKRKELLAEYPGLLTNTDLQDAVLTASQAEQGLVNYVAETRAAETSDVESPMTAEVIPITTTGQPAGGVAGEFVMAVVAGSVFSIDAATGDLLWRRHVGIDNGVDPLDLPGGDVLLFDSTRREFVRLNGRDGAIKWRLAIDAQPVDTPLLTPDGLFAATDNRRLLHINLDSGQQQGYYEFPQGLRNSPAASRDGGFLYLLGEHSNLFVLNQRERTCTMVMHLGHEAGEVHIGPQLLGAYLIVPQDSGAANSRILVLEVADGGASVSLKQSNLEIPGHVFHPPTAAGKLVIISTDHGGHYVYDVKPAGATVPLTSIAQLSGISGRTAVPFTYVRGSEFWSAGKGLVKYEIQATASSIRPSWSRRTDDTYLQPLRAIGDTLFTLRRAPNTAGDLLAAVQLSSGEPIWEAHIGAPIVDQPWISADGALNAVNVVGAMFRVPASGGTSDQSGSAAGTLVLTPVATAAMQQVLSREVATQPLAADARAIPQQATNECLSWTGKAFSVVALPGESACPPVAFGGNLMVPSKDGRIYLVNPNDGSNVTEPFQPVVQPGTEYNWISQNDGANDDSDVLLFDGAGKVYLVGIESQPREYLAAHSEVNTMLRLRAPLIRLGNFAYAAEGRKNIIPISLTDRVVSLGDAIEIPDGIVWGPHKCGNLAVVCSTTGKLYAFDDSGNAAWADEPAESPADEDPNLLVSPVGKPLPDAAGFWVAQSTGMLVHVNSTSGAIDGRVDFRRPLAGGPVVWENKLVAAGYDGTLYMIAKP